MSEPFSDLTLSQEFQPMAAQNNVFSYDVKLVTMSQIREFKSLIDRSAATQQ